MQAYLPGPLPNVGEVLRNTSAIYNQYSPSDFGIILQLHPLASIMASIQSILNPLDYIDESQPTPTLPNAMRPLPWWLSVVRRFEEAATASPLAPRLSISQKHDDHNEARIATTPESPTSISPNAEPSASSRQVDLSTTMSTQGILN